MYITGAIKQSTGAYMTIKWFAERWHIKDLKAHNKNPRRFTKKGLADLGKSILESTGQTYNELRETER